tara:strand:+ start:294 stop:416 length:123 start_codon:yes stop_codon:yes gene_type:complete
MIKKFLLIIIISIFVFSCGKKDDPEYKESKYKYINQKNIV